MDKRAPSHAKPFGTSSASLFEAARRVDEYFQEVAPPNTATDPVGRLQRWFSLHAVISTTSPHAEHQKAAALSLQPPFSEIGRGYTGVVYEVPRENRVVKKAISRELAANLWNDFSIGVTVHAHFAAASFYVENSSILPRTPRYFGFYEAKDKHFVELWKKTSARFPAGHTQPYSFMVVERVLPLPMPIRDDLIDLFAPPSLVEAAKKSKGNKDAIARLYLGRKRRTTQSRFFSLRNFPLHLDQALVICPDDVDRFASEMGTALAVLHWSCQVDAADVEFVLASAPTAENFECVDTFVVQQFGPVPRSVNADTQELNFQRRTVHLWIIDFDKVKKMTLDRDGINQAIVAAEENDPYYPKPVADKGSREHALWRTFGESYLAASKGIIERKGHKNCADLPVKFLQGWREYRERKVRAQASSGADVDL
jgi:Zinc finger protein